LQNTTAAIDEQNQYLQQYSTILMYLHLYLLLINHHSSSALQRQTRSTVNTYAALHKCGLIFSTYDIKICLGERKRNWDQQAYTWDGQAYRVAQ